MCRSVVATALRVDELSDDAVVVEDLDEVDDLLFLGFFFSLFLGFGFGLLDLFIAGLVSRPVRTSGDGATLGGAAALVGRTFEVIAEAVTGVVGTVCGVGNALEAVQDAGVGAAQLMQRKATWPSTELLL